MIFPKVVFPLCPLPYKSSQGIQLSELYLILKINGAIIPHFKTVGNMFLFFQPLFARRSRNLAHFFPFSLSNSDVIF